MVLIDKKQIETIKKELETYDNLREDVIKRSRDVIKDTKLLIYSLQRDDNKESRKYLTQLKKTVKKIDEIVKKDVRLKNEGTYKVAMQEYVEAQCFFNFVHGKKIPSHKTMKVTAEDYILGLCDLTGELERRAVIKATSLKYHDVQRIKLLVEEVFGDVLRLNPRKSELRKKIDSVKWNLKRIEEVLYHAVKNG